MRIIYITIFILIIVIIFLYKKKISQEHFDSTNSFSQEGLYNILSSYNTIQIDNSTPTNNILGSLDLNGKIDISNNISVSNIITNDISSNNITSNNIQLRTIDLARYKICLKNTKYCVNPNLINLYSKINSNDPVFNNMYLPDALNCEIFEPNSFRDTSHNYIPKRILSQFGYGIDASSYIKPTINDISGNIDINDLPQLAVSNLLTIGRNNYITGITSNLQPYVFPKPAYYFLPATATNVGGHAQIDYDNSVGFKISIPPLPFKCKVVWIQVPLYYPAIGINGRKNRSFRVTYTSSLDNPIVDYVYSTHKVGNTSYYMPDGSDYNGIDSSYYYEYTQWVPIPINYDQMPTDKALYLRRNRTEIGDSTANSLFMISGIAFSTNPWNHCKISAYCIHYDLNRRPNNANTNRNISNPATIYDTDSSSDFIKIDGKLFSTKLPVINNGKDKILYLNILKDKKNINLNSVYISTVDPVISSSTGMFEITDSYNNLVINNQIQKLDNFATSYDNPFARFFNSHAYNRYIATIIPATIITSDFVYVILQSQITSGSSLTIREMGTHDLIPSF